MSRLFQINLLRPYYECTQSISHQIKPIAVSVSPVCDAPNKNVCLTDLEFIHSRIISQVRLSNSEVLTNLHTRLSYLKPPELA